jgi:hypothetical protein
LNEAPSNAGAASGGSSPDPVVAPASATGTGLTINISYDPSVASAPAGFTAAVSQVVQFFETHFSDPVTINIAVGYGEVGNQALAAGALGQSITYYEQFGYSTIRDALIADATTAADATAVASLPSANPNGGAYGVTTAEGKALGLVPANAAGLDGYVGFSSAPGAFDYDRSDGITHGTFDFYAVVAHEMSEIMGRMLTVGGSYLPLDLFHYSSPGTREFSRAGYFSIDGGTTSLNTFNSRATGDAGDWRGDTADAFNSMTLGGLQPISDADITALDAIGWDASTSPPAVSPPNWNILWQNDSGQAASWVMNGTNLVTGSLAGANPGTSWHAIALADVNGDGTKDILWRSDDGTPAVWLMNGMSILSGATLPNPGTAWHFVGTQDFNGDGKADILWQNSDGTPAVWLMNGTTILSGAALPNPGTAWRVVGAGDFNGDGKSDILLQNSSGQAAVWLMNGTNIVGQATVGPNPGTAWRAVAAADFNGDGKADILWQNVDGTPAIWFMNGTAMMSGAVAGSDPGSSWRVVGAADVNGDGNADILWQNWDGTPAVWFMNGTTLLSGATLPNPGSPWHALAMAR